MGRPELPVDPQTGPVADFACQLRILRETAGRPAYWKMARRCGVSKSSLAAASSGRALPSWPVVVAFVVACGDRDLALWREKWSRTRTAALTSDGESSSIGTPAFAGEQSARAAAEVILGELVGQVVDEYHPSYGTLARRPAIPELTSLRDANAGPPARERPGERPSWRPGRATVLATIVLLTGMLAVMYQWHGIGAATPHQSIARSTPSTKTSPVTTPGAGVPTSAGVLAIASPTGSAGQVHCGRPADRLVCQGGNPLRTGCAADSYVAVTASLAPVRIVVLYSPTCQAAWAALTAPKGYSTRIELDTAAGFHTCYPAGCARIAAINTTKCGFLAQPSPCMWTDLVHLTNTVGAEATAIASWRDPGGRSGHRFVSLTGDDVPVN